VGTHASNSRKGVGCIQLCQLPTRFRPPKPPPHPPPTPPPTSSPPQGLRGEGEADDAAYDPEDAHQRNERLKVAEGMWKELPPVERREYVVQAEQGERAWWGEGGEAGGGTVVGGPCLVIDLAHCCAAACSALRACLSTYR